VKAIALNRYGGPEVLEQADLPTPKIGPDGILVRARTVGVNPVDWKMREGRLDAAFPSHFPLVPGWDVAGVVEAVGPAVTAFAVGDEVLGYVRRDDVQHGTYAELVPAPERTLVIKPAGLGWVEAGALPLAGLTAYQVLKAVHVGKGDTVLVHAAAGGVGHLAVQLARILGAERVIGTASEHNHDFLRGLGVEPVTYGAEVPGHGRYASSEPAPSSGLADRVRALAPEGVDAALDLVGGEAIAVSAELVSDSRRLGSIIDAATVKQAGGAYVFVKPDAPDLAALAGFVEDGRLTVHIERTFPLAGAADAQQLIEQMHVRGKLVLEV
jgi:NADPH:quinone reductase-like Zn-dependent oxidoreductase